ncbi:MAG: protein kinase domain-containing protein [Limisphaerales bacterium]
MNETGPDPMMPNGKKCPQCGAALPAGALAGLCPACLLKQGAAADTGVASEAPGKVGPNGTKVVEPPGHPPIAELAKLFPQLEILAFIGQGGMGAVYQARQPALDRLVALKILQAAGGAGFSERFTREARALARLNHPNIVAVYEFGQVGNRGEATGPAEKTLTPALSHPMGEGGATAPGEGGGLHYFIMEFIDGLNLRQLEQAGKLSPREALQIIPQICDALQYAHDEGVVHRDIKPENVLIDRKGRVKIADFGLAKILGRESATARLTSEGQVMGTPHYMAPEQVEHPQDVDHRADIYSLGVVFYEMLTGELPMGRFAPPSQKVHIDVRLDEVVLHALEKEPKLRYQHASEVKTDVETITASTPNRGQTAAPPRGVSPPAGASFPKGGHRAAVTVAAFVFVLAMLVSAAVTFQLPKSYVGVARVTAEIGHLRDDPYFMQVQMERITSRAVLGGVLKDLDKNLRLRNRMERELGVAFSDAEALQLVRFRLSVVQTRNTSLLEIRYYAEWPDEAAEVANQIAEVYCKLPASQGAEIIDRAEPSLRPVRPNVPLNLTIGALTGVVLGLFSGGLTLLLTWWRQRNRSQPAGAPANQTVPPMPPRADRFWKRFAVAATVVLLALILVPAGLIAIGLIVPMIAKQKAVSEQQALAARAALLPNFTVTGLVTDATSGRLQASNAPIGESPLTFGPVRDRVIEEPVAPRYLWFDLDSGNPVAWSNAMPPGSVVSDEEIEAWKAWAGADIAAGPDLRSLGGSEMVALPVTGEQWVGMTPSALQGLLSGARLERRVTLNGESGEPATYAIKTREGGMGLLQILGMSRNPRGTKIRYKLVQQASQGGAGPTAPARTNAAPMTGNVAALRLKLQFAEQEIKEVEKRREVGMATSSDYEKAKGTRDIASAELLGDATEVARIRLRLAELELKEVENTHRVGVATPLDYEKAKCSRDIAAAEMKGDRLEVMRLKLRIAELELHDVEKMRENGRATPGAYEQAKLARDLAAVAYSQEQKKQGDANTSPRSTMRIDSENGKVRIKVGANILETDSVQLGVETNGAMVITSTNLSLHTLPNAEPAAKLRLAPTNQRTNDTK